jgi:hypothetical protein
MATSNGIPEWMAAEIREALFHEHKWFCRMVLMGLAEVEDEGHGDE